MSDFYDFKIRALDGHPLELMQFQGHVLLVVNVASRCGFTPQYEGLQRLYTRYQDRGFCILGCPCDQFGHQEPGSAEEITAFCRLNYGVSFPLTEKLEVNGPEAHPIYRWLKQQQPGLLGSEAIKWNFTKFLLDRDGQIVGRYAPQTPPEELESTIVALL